MVAYGNRNLRYDGYVVQIARVFLPIISMHEELNIASARLRVFLVFENTAKRAYSAMEAKY
jgi:hypothetical protein